MKLEIKKVVAAMLSLTYICSTMTPSTNIHKLVKPDHIADAASLCVECEEEINTFSKNIIQEGQDNLSNTENLTTPSDPDKTETITSSTTTAVAATTTTTKVTTTETSATTSMTTAAALTNEQLFKNADVNDDGNVDVVDSSKILSSLLVKSELPEGKGDANGDGEVNIIDAMIATEHRARISTGSDLSDFFINLSKAPRTMEKSVTISQDISSGNDNDEYCEFVFKIDSEQPVIAATATLLFNGKTPAEAGIKEIDITSESKKYVNDINLKNGKLLISSSFRSTMVKDSFIFHVYGIKAGEYAISYDNLKFYGTDGTEYSSYTKKDFNPYMTVNATPSETAVTTTKSTITAPTTTTTKATTTETSATTTATTTPALTNEQLFKNADIDGNGQVDSVDSSLLQGVVLFKNWSYILKRHGLPASSLLPEGFGDVNCDGNVNVVDILAIMGYYVQFVMNYDVSDYFINLSKAPRTMEKSVTISQDFASGSEIDEYCDFALEMDSELPITAAEGILLFNGKVPDEAGIKMIECESSKYSVYINDDDGHFIIHSSLRSSNGNGRVIFHVSGIKAGEYAISYDDLKFYGTDGTEYSGYTEKGFNPYMTVNAASSESKRSLGDVDGNGILDAVDASRILANYAKYSTSTSTPTEEDLALCDINKDGYIDAVDASRVLAFYAHTSTGGKLSFEEFMKNK